MAYHKFTEIIWNHNINVAYVNDIIYTEYSYEQKNEDQHIFAACAGKLFTVTF